MNKKELIDIFNDTEEIIQNNETIKEDLRASLNNIKFYFNQNPKLKLRFPQYTFDNVYITPKSTIKAAEQIKDSFSKVAILNFASATNPGGGVTKGSSAQEECLCRCSYLYDCLNSSKCWNTFYTPNRKEGTNLHSDRILYIPDVTIIKDEKYNLYKTPFKVDVITCAAPNLRDNPSNEYNSEPNKIVNINDQQLYELHLKRAVSILESAYKNNVEAIILGAFGCGAFRNNPYVVASAFKTALTAYADKFKYIEFAVYCSGDKTNYYAFKKVFSEAKLDYTKFFSKK